MSVSKAKQSSAAGVVGGYAPLDGNLRVPPQYLTNPGFIGARVRNSADQAMVNNTWTSVTFNTEDYDTDGFHSTSSNTSRFTIPAGMSGKYLVGGSIAFAANATNYRSIRFYKNNATRVGGELLYLNDGASLPTRMTSSDVLELLPGDFIEFQGWQDSGGDLNSLTAADFVPLFWIVKLDSGKVGAGIGAKAYNSTTQSVADTTEVALTFDTEEFDTDGFHSTSSNTSRFTIPAGLGGKYLLQGSSYNSEDGVVLGFWRLNGTTAIKGSYSRNESPSGTNQSRAVNPVGVADLVAGDYVEMVVVQTSGVAANFGNASIDSARSAASIMRLDSGSDTGPYASRLVKATYTSSAATTSDTYQDTGLQVSIAPTNPSAIIEVEVYGEVNQTWAAGSPANLLCWYQIYNSTDAVSVHEQAMGENPPLGIAGRSLYGALALRGYYTVNSTAARTFKFRQKSNVATNVESSIRGDRGAGVVMVAREVRP